MIHNRLCELPEGAAHMEGDTLSFLLNDGEAIEAMAVKQESDGTVYITVDCLAEEYALQEDGNYGDGYESCDLRKKLNEEILERFPEELRKMMVPFENGDLLRIPTEREIFGKNEYGIKEPDTVQQFECMKLRRNRIAFQGKNGPWEWYWLQNRGVYSATDACFVDSGGDAGGVGASGSFGVRPLFKIQNP